MKTRKLFYEYSCLFVCLAVSLLPGCGASELPKASDEQHAYATVEGLGDMAGSASSFAKAFAPGSAPDNRKEYAERGYQVAGDLVIDGESATVPVEIFGGVIVTSEDDRRATQSSASGSTMQTWTLIRSGDEWKIKDAPLG